MIKMFSLVLDLLKVCLYVKMELSVLQDLLCKSAWLDQSKIRLNQSKLVHIVFLQNFPTQPKPVWCVGFYVLSKYKRKNLSHVLWLLLMLCVWIFCKIKRWLLSHIFRVSKIQDYVKNLVIDSVAALRA